MTEYHLKSLKKELEKNHWRISNETGGNGYNISGVWKVTRPNNSKSFHIEFEGLHEERVLSMNNAYGCTVKEDKSISAYFGKASKSWPKELSQFIENINKNFT
jgi:hypothetical protein